MDLQEVLEQAKIGIGAKSDYALSKRLGISNSAVAEWRQLKRFPNTVNCEKLAVFSGIPLHRVLGVVGEARAISQEEKRVWRKLAGAALIAGIVLVSAFPAGANEASLYIMLFAVWVTMRVTFSARLTHRRPPNTNAGTLRPAWT